MINIQDYQQICYICLQNTNENLIKPCFCINTCVHENCLLKWISVSKKEYCLVCNYEYKYEKVFIKDCKIFKRNLIKNFCNCKYTIENDIDFNICIIIFVSSVIEFCFIPLINYTLNETNIFIILSFFFFKIVIFFINKFFFKKKFPFNYFIYWEIFVSLIYYICIIIDFSLNINNCQTICSLNNNLCNNECDYYSIYITKNNKYISLLIFKLSIAILLLLLKFSLKIINSIYFNKIMEYNR